MLFDLDNTLTPRRACVEAFAGLFAAEWGERLGPVGDGELRGVFLDVDRMGYNPRRAADLLEQLDWRSAPTAEEIEVHWQTRFPLAAMLREGVRELLGELRDCGVKLGCVTNGGVREQQAKLDHLELTGSFDAILISEAVGCKKPDPRIFEAALAEVGAAAGETWFVGDHPLNDVVGARRVGMEGVWVREDAYSWPAGEAPPAHVVESFGELRGVLGVG